MTIIHYCLDGRWCVLVSTRTVEEVKEGLYRRWPGRITGIRVA